VPLDAALPASARRTPRADPAWLSAVSCLSLVLTLATVVATAFTVARMLG
jgi:hypothetical protein